MASEQESFNVLGSLLIAYFLNWGLLGVLVVQTYTYYIAFPGDALYRKIFVYTVVVLSIIQTCLTTDDGARMFNIGAPQLLQGPPKDFLSPWLTIPIMHGFFEILTHSFFVYHIRSILRSWVPVAVISVLTITSSCIAIGIGATVYNADSFDAVPSAIVNILIPVETTTNAACDSIIAVYMLYIFIYDKERGIAKSPLMSGKIIRLFMETGIVAACVSISLCFLCTVVDLPCLFIIPAVLITKIYAIGILVILNNRLDIVGSRASMASSEKAGFEWGLLAKPHLVKRKSWRIKQETELPLGNVADGIRVHKEVWSDADVLHANSGSHLIESINDAGLRGWQPESGDWTRDEMLRIMAWSLPRHDGPLK